MMENPEGYGDEVYEADAEEEILDEEIMGKMIKSTKKEADVLEACSKSPAAAGFDSSEALRTQPEMTEKAFLDLFFGELPPKSLIKTNLLFAKPEHPKRRPQTRHFPLFINKQIFIADEIGEAKVLEKINKDESARKHFVRVGGMLALPVPVPGPLFNGEEM